MLNFILIYDKWTVELKIYFLNDDGKWSWSDIIIISIFIIIIISSSVFQLLNIGKTCDVCPTGPVGPVGPVGPLGLKGDTGQQGLQGERGVAGPPGSNGRDGLNGSAGPAGPAGPAGSQGPPGSNGRDGSNGSQGPAGPAGSPGSNGRDGSNGTNGRDGSNGSQGPAGPAGPQGIQGIQGTPGVKGERGETGPPITDENAIRILNDIATTTFNSAYAPISVVKSVDDLKLYTETNIKNISDSLIDYAPASRVDNLAENINKLTIDMIDLKTDIDKISVSLNTYASITSVNELKEHINDLKANIASISDNLINNYANISSIDTLVKNIDQLKLYIDSIYENLIITRAPVSSVTTISENVNDITEIINSILADLNNLAPKSSITSLETDVSNLASNISTNYAPISSVTNLATDLSTNYAPKSSVTNLATDLSTNYAPKSSVTNLATDLSTNYAPKSSVTNLATNLSTNYALKSSVSDLKTYIETNIQNIFTDLSTLEARIVPIGTIISYGGEITGNKPIPTGYLVCNGEEKLRYDYGALFSAIGFSYGTPSSVTKFKLPDIRSRVVLGSDLMGTTIDTVVGATGGESRTTLTVKNLPSHSHANTISVSGTIDQAGVHSHIPTVYSSYTGVNYKTKSIDDSGWYQNRDVLVPASGDASHAHLAQLSDSGSHTHNLNLTSSITNASTGSDASFSNLPPYIVVNYLIKAVNNMGLTAKISNNTPVAIM
jgi:microcystin-dependent protein